MLIMMKNVLIIATQQCKKTMFTWEMISLSRHQNVNICAHWISWWNGNKTSVHIEQNSSNRNLGVLVKSLTSKKIVKTIMILLEVFSFLSIIGLIKSVSGDLPKPQMRMSQQQFIVELTKKTFRDTGSRCLSPDPCLTETKASAFSRSNPLIYLFSHRINLSTAVTNELQLDSAASWTRFCWTSRISSRVCAATSGRVIREQRWRRKNPS